MEEKTSGPIAKMRELVAMVDAEITYPAERIFERYLPGVDNVIDYVLTGVFVVEDMFTGAMGIEKKQQLLDVLLWLWEIAPVPVLVRRFITPVYTAAMGTLIDKLVGWLNSKLPAGTRDLCTLMPADTMAPEEAGAKWLVDVLTGTEAPAAAVEGS